MQLPATSRIRMYVPVWPPFGTDPTVFPVEIALVSSATNPPPPSTSPRIGDPPGHGGPGGVGGVDAPARHGHVG